MYVTHLPESRHAAEAEIAQLEARSVISDNRLVVAYRMWRLAFLRGLIGKQ
jgi:hypothetical protein